MLAQAQDSRLIDLVLYVVAQPLQIDVSRHCPPSLTIARHYSLQSIAQELQELWTPNESWKKAIERVVKLKSTWKVDTVVHEDFAHAPAQFIVG
ncbi:MAG: hypothetical protein ACLQAT_05190 [Candidatus Binataceae bacterium]